MSAANALPATVDLHSIPLLVLGALLWLVVFAVATEHLWLPVVRCAWIGVSSLLMAGKGLCVNLVKGWGV